MSMIGSREFWIPGWRQAALFLLLVLLGLGVWAIRVPFLGQAYHTGMVLYALLALALGFVLPKGFYLWGVAIVLSHPFAALALTSYEQAQGADIVRGGVVGWVGLAFVFVLMTFNAAMLTTVLSAAGAGLRLLLKHLRQGHSGRSQDARMR